MAIEIPNFATHYYRADKKPFLNLSDLTDAHLAALLPELADDAAAGNSQRVFGARYMEFRRLTEAKMRELIQASGGKPVRSSPHYFVLGASEWFRRLHPSTLSIEMLLSKLPTEVTSVTYPDSFTAMGLGPLFGLPYTAKPYHGRVFRLEEIEMLVRNYGMPVDEADDVYEGSEHRDFEKYIEIQVWSDQPLLHLLGNRLRARAEICSLLSVFP
jgi:hypothetical protein